MVLSIPWYSPARLVASRSNRRLKKLPAEIVLCVIDYVALPQLIRMAHVCHEWRVLAYSHPAFWRIIEVGSVRPAALQCMLGKLAASDALIERISFELPVDDPAIDAVVFPALAAHLHRIEHLCVTFHPSKAAAFFRALHAGGPRLKDLEITFHSEEITILDHPIIPSDLLGGQAPHLFQFTGGNVSLPEEPVAVFASVVDAGWVATSTPDCENMLVVSPRLISLHFPGLRDLFLDAPECVMEHDLGSGAFSSQLQSLYMTLNYTAHEPLAFIPPAARPRSITFGTPCGGDLSLVLADLAAAPLRARLGRPSIPHFDPALFFEAELGHLHDDTTRRTLELFRDFGAARKDTPPLFAAAADWCARVAELVLEDRILHVDGVDMVGSPATQIRCPALKTIVVTGDPSVLLHQQKKITEFLERGLVSPIDRISFRVDATSDSLCLVHQSED